MIIDYSYHISMESIFNRLTMGLYFDVEFKPYSENFLKKVLNYYSDIEEYEKCIFLDDILKNEFSNKL